jgi:hypothetical protein
MPSTIPDVNLGFDSALARVAKTTAMPSTIPDVNEPIAATGAAVSSDSDPYWTWIGLGVGMAALLATALAGLYLTARHRSRVALP